MKTAWNSFWRTVADAARFGSPDTRYATVTMIAGQALIVIIPGYALISWYFARQPSLAYACLAWAWSVGVMGLIAVRRGWLRLSAQVLVVALWSTVAGLVLCCGADSPHVGAFAPAIVGASVLLSPAATMSLTVASIVTFVGAAHLQMSGSLGPVPSQPPDVLAPITQLLATGGFSAAVVFAFSVALEKLSQREAALQESELRYAGLFDHSPDGILLIAPEGEIRTLNPAAMAMLGTGEGQMSGASFLGLPFAEGSLTAAQELARGQRASAELMLYRDGRPRVLAVNATRLEVPTTTEGAFLPTNVQLTLRDVTQLREQEEAQRLLEARLKRSERVEAIGQLAGGVAHDFNNILTGILGHVDLLRMRLEKLSGGAKLIAGLDELERSANRGAAITRQLLIFRRKGEAETGAADVAHTIRESQELFRRMLRKQVTLDFHIEDTGAVAISSSAVEQVVMNLLVNAGDAVKEGGRIALHARALELSEPRRIRDRELPAGSYVWLCVEDDGEGMSSAVLSRIFEPFFTTKPIGQGTGLGLSTIHGIVKRCGGHMVVDSKLYEGTRFEVYLPRVATPEKRHQVTRVPLPRGAQQIILVCEDEDTIRNLVSDLLSAHGYRVHATGSPREALAIALRLGAALELLLTDVIMPELTGPQLAAAIKSELPDLVVLYMSGYTGGLLRDLGIDESSAGLLPKPFSAAELLRTVAEHLSTAEQTAS